MKWETFTCSALLHHQCSCIATLVLLFMTQQLTSSFIPEWMNKKWIHQYVVSRYNIVYHCEPLKACSGRGFLVKQTFLKIFLKKEENTQRNMLLFALKILQKQCQCWQAHSSCSHALLAKSFSYFITGRVKKVGLKCPHMLWSDFQGVL